MKPRVEYSAAAPGAVQAMRGLEQYLDRTNLDGRLRDLVRLRASLINGCAFCVNLHSNALRVAGETETRLQLVSVWRDAPVFTPPERAAFAWTDAVTHLHTGHVSDEVFAEVRPHFTDGELVDLTLAVATINAWNRLSIAFRAVPETVETTEQVLA